MYWLQYYLSHRNCWEALSEAPRSCVQWLLCRLQTRRIGWQPLGKDCIFPGPVLLEILEWMRPAPLKILKMALVPFDIMFWRFSFNLHAICIHLPTVQGHNLKAPVQDLAERRTPPHRLPAAYRDSEVWIWNPIELLPKKVSPGVVNCSPTIWIFRILQARHLPNKKLNRLNNLI